MTISDGSTASYYELPKGCTELQDLISHRNLNAQDGEIFRAVYRKGMASHSDALRDAKKVLFYATAEVKRLELARDIAAGYDQEGIDSVSFAKPSPAFAEKIKAFEAKAKDEISAAFEDAINSEKDAMIATGLWVAKDDGWIKWEGGDCPTESGATVSVRFLDGDEATDDEPERWAGWVTRGQHYSIIAYRIHKAGV